MIRSIKITWLILLLPLSGISQSETISVLKPSDTLNTSRRNVVVITQAALSTLSLIALNELWYNDFERSKFHTVDDFDEWLQLDKVGHIYSSYHLGRLSAEALNWSGVSKKDQLIYGATLGFGYLAVVEIMDGYSQEWGFSWSDIGANAVGTGLYIGQELLWDDQRIDLKYSFNRTALAKQRPDKLGENFLQEVLKDYNGQTYWLSFNLRSFFPQTKLPKWLNVALGYGGYGMVTARPNTAVDLYGEQDRFRQYFLSLDVDLTKIETKSHVLRTIFSLINVLKIPAPTIEFNRKNKLKLHLLHY